MTTTIQELRGVVADLPEAEYHAHHAFSSTQARKILESPADYAYSLTQPEEHKDAYDVGSAVHAKVLGVGARVQVLDFDDYRTAKAREAKQDAYNAGEIPMLKKAMGPIDAMAEAVLAHRSARAVLEQDGTAEASVFGRDDAYGVDMRARFDFLPAAGNRRRIAADLKTTAGEVTKKGMAKSVGDREYEVQRAHYLDTLRFATGEEDVEMVFIFVRKAAPHHVGVGQLNREYVDMGHTKAAHARETLRRCLDTNAWPGPSDQITLLQPEFWAVTEFTERFGDA